jgi:hypothetical protein
MKQENIVEKALAILSRQPKSQPPKGITVADVLRVLPRAKVILPTVEDLTKPKSCEHCGANKHAKIVRRTWPDGKLDWMCQRCGREANPNQ